VAAVNIAGLFFEWLCATVVAKIQSLRESFEIFLKLKCVGEENKVAVAISERRKNNKRKRVAVATASSSSIPNTHAPFKMIASRRCVLLFLACVSVSSAAVDPVYLGYKTV
jgi:hypothetical protein